LRHGGLGRKDIKERTQGFFGYNKSGFVNKCGGCLSKGDGGNESEKSESQMQIWAHRILNRDCSKAAMQLDGETDSSKKKPREGVQRENSRDQIKWRGGKRRHRRGQKQQEKGSVLDTYCRSKMAGNGRSLNSSQGKMELTWERPKKREGRIDCILQKSSLWAAWIQGNPKNGKAKWNGPQGKGRLKNNEE